MNVSPSSQAVSDKSSSLSLKAQDRGIVVFHVLPSLRYSFRMAMAFALLIGGLLLQSATGSFWHGAALLLMGSLLLCVKGYHNRVERGHFDPASDWDVVEMDRLQELLALDRKMLRWNRSFMDLTHPWGLLTLVVLMSPLFYMGFHLMEYGSNPYPSSVQILFLDAALILLPHWVTGTRRILRLPKLMVKVEALQSLLKLSKGLLQDEKLSVLMLLGGNHKIPEDVKLRIQPEGVSKDFLGLYIQVSTNDVQGKTYPYVYAVLVAREGFGLDQAQGFQQQDDGTIDEFQRQGDVEILVIRLYSKRKNSGYHTKPDVALRIFKRALNLTRLLKRVDGNPGG